MAARTGSVVGPTAAAADDDDANNNSNVPNQQHKPDERQVKRPMRWNSPEQANNSDEPAGGGECRRLSGSETDDWHLLEVDDQYSSDESIIAGRIVKKSKMSAPNGSDSRKLLVSNNNNDDIVIKKKYVDIDPLLKANEVHSRFLIYLCTVLYALIPLASTLALIGLIVLAFTSYWPITVAYLSYLIYDRNTCNRGKFV